MKAKRAQARQRFSKSDVALRYCLKFPEASNRTIARTLVEQEPGLFPSVDAARCCVRALRGAHGKCRMLQRDKRPLGWQAELPKSLAIDNRPYDLRGDNRVLILSDIHLPFHDKRALEAALDFGRKYRPTMIILNGDTVDHKSFSPHENDPRNRDTARELQITREFLGLLRERFRKSRIIYKIGNHEIWLERYLVRQAPVLLGVPDFELKNLLNFDDLGIEQVLDKQFMQLGNLTVLHGHELPKGIASPVNPARGLFMRLSSTSLCGHFHQRSEHTETNGPPHARKHVSCWTTGCLCHLSPDYATINKWSHGFANGEVRADDTFEINNRVIIGGKVY